MRCASWCYRCGVTKYRIYDESYDVCIEYYLYLYIYIYIYIYGYFSSNFNGLVICWIVNGLFQGIWGPSLSKYCDTNIKTTSIHLLWSILVFGSNLGYFLGPFILSNNNSCSIMFNNLGNSNIIIIVITIYIYI